VNAFSLPGRKRVRMSANTARTSAYATGALLMKIVKGVES
jgi:hypothetical protein